MSKSFKDNHKRNQLAIDAHFRNSAGPMKSKKDKKEYQVKNIAHYILDEYSDWNAADDEISINTENRTAKTKTFNLPNFAWENIA